MYIKEFNKLIKNFPTGLFETIQGGGVNIRFDKFVVTVWFKKRKYSINNVWSTYTNINDMINIITNKLHQKPVITKTEPIVQVDNGVQKCIDHVKAKLSKLEKSKPNAVAQTILLALTHELEQYLL